MLLNLRYLPNVLITDMPQHLVSHSQARDAILFHPNNGMIVEATDANLEQAKSHNLSISKRYLSENFVVGISNSENAVEGSESDATISGSDDSDVQSDVEDSEVGRPLTDRGRSEMHPVSRSKTHLCLVDKFHQSNSRDKFQLLRYTDNIKELAKVNSQVCENKFSIERRLKHSLNKMSPGHHMFCHRYLMDMHNTDINRKYLKSGRIWTYMLRN